MGFYKDLTDILIANSPVYEHDNYIRHKKQNTPEIQVALEPEELPEVTVPEDLEVPKTTANKVAEETTEEPADTKWQMAAQTNSKTWSDVNFRNMLLDAQLQHESGFNPKAVSHDKYGNPVAYGIAQFIPSTWQWAKDMGWIERDAEPFDVTASIKAQQALMNNLWHSRIVSEAADEDDRMDRALACYNAGIENVRIAVKEARKTGADWKDSLPKPEETIPYINRIRNQINRYKTDTSYKFKYDRSHLNY